jgi:hypothetical protein
VDQSHIADIIEIEQLLARYAVGMSKHDIDAVIGIFTPDGTYSAFGEQYTLEDFPTLAQAAPRGLYNTSTPAITLHGDTADGVQPLCFIAQTDHSMRLGYYTDTYVRTRDGWRLRTRVMTFMRRSGAHDSGRAHDPLRPLPGAKASA